MIANFKIYAIEHLNLWSPLYNFVGQLIDLDFLVKKSLPLLRVLGFSQCGLELVEINLIEKLSDFDFLTTIMLPPEVDTAG